MADFTVNTIDTTSVDHLAAVLHTNRAVEEDYPLAVGTTSDNEEAKVLEIGVVQDLQVV